LFVCCLFNEQVHGLSVSREEAAGSSQAVSFDKGVSARTLAWSTIDGNFLTHVAEQPSDLLIMLFSPTCPDCQWLMGRWASLAQQLQKLPSIAVWTVADPGFLAPKPFEHWHNPSIFFSPALHKDKPVMFPDTIFGAYLEGNVSVSQDIQDAQFQDELINFVGKRASLPLDIYAVVQDDSIKNQKDLEALAKKEWKMLQSRWQNDGPEDEGWKPLATSKKPSAQPAELPEQALHQQQSLKAARLAATKTKPIVAKPTPPMPRPVNLAASPTPWHELLPKAVIPNADLRQQKVTVLTPHIARPRVAENGDRPHRGPGGCHHTCSKPPWEAFLERAVVAAGDRAEAFHKNRRNGIVA